MNPIRNLSLSGGGHFDYGYDSQGNEVCVGTDDNNTRKIYMIRIDNGVRTYLLSDSQMSWYIHISCRNLNRPGWAYLTEFADVNSQKSKANFQKIFAVKLDPNANENAVTETFAHVHHSDYVDYERGPFGVPNRDGSKVMFRSDWMVNSSSADIDSYIAYMPQTSCTGFSSSTTVTNESCIGCADGSVTLSVTGGTSPFTYAWSNGSTTKNISGLSLGTYSVTVTDKNAYTTTNTVKIKTTYRILKTAVTPTIDGNINEFMNADSLVFTIPSGAKASVKTIWNTTGLYIAANITDTQLNAAVTARDGTVWDEDGLEFFIDNANNEGATMDANDYQLLLNLLNTQCDVGNATGLTWNGTWQSAAILNGTNNNNTDTDNGYSLELAVPWTTIGYSTPPSAGKIVGLDFAIDDKQAAGKSNIQWPNNTSSFQTPDNWQKGILSSTFVSITTAINEKDMRFNVSVFPNPINNYATIYYSLTTNNKVNITLTDALGRELMNIVNEEQTSGEHKSSINTDGIANGIYFLQTTINGTQTVQKLVVSK